MKAQEKVTAMKVLTMLYLLSSLVLADPGDRIDWRRVTPLIKVPRSLAIYSFIDSDHLLKRHGAMKRIFGGSIALRNSFPYQVGILLKTPRGLNWCGGSLISKEYVVTAAHCLDTSMKALVFLGAHEIRKPNESGQKRISVERKNFIIHPAWNPWRLKNDIALLKLPKPVEFSDEIQPVKLPTTSQTVEGFEGKFATASGWGRFSTASKTISFLLRYVELPVLDQRICYRSYPGILQSTNICTSGANGKSTCMGDSGGPLVMEDGDSKVLIGVTSFGSVLGCEKGFPGVYTRISAYLRWITDVTGIDVD